MPSPSDVSRFLAESVRLLAERGDVDRVILFGSHAWGTPRPDSDVDLLVMVRSREPPFDRAVTLRRFLTSRGQRVPFDLVALTPEELAARLEMKDHFVEIILRRGRVLLGN